MKPLHQISPRHSNPYHLSHKEEETSKARSPFAEANHATLPTSLLVAVAVALQFLHSSAVGSPLHPQTPPQPPPPLAVSPPRLCCQAPPGATRSRRNSGRRTFPWARGPQRRAPAPPFPAWGRCRAKSVSCCCWEPASRRPTCCCSSVALPGTRGVWSPWTLFSPLASWAATTPVSLPRLNTHYSEQLSENLFRMMLLGRGREEMWKCPWGCSVPVSGFWVCVCVA